LFNPKKNAVMPPQNPTNPIYTQSFGAMKRLLASLLCCFGSAYGQMKVPSSVHRLPNLEAASQKAVADGKLLVFIMVNPASPAAHVADAFDEYVKRFRTYGPVVLVPQGTNPSQLPPAAVRGFNSLSGGYPRLVVIDPSNGELVESVPYIRVDDRPRALRRHRSVVAKYQRDQRILRRRPAPPVPEPPRPAPPVPEPPRPAPPVPAPPPEDAGEFPGSDIEPS